jgi:hypothetical protein
MSQPQSVSSTPSAAEKGALLDDLLAARPDLRVVAEILAARRTASEESEESAAVADDVEATLRGLDIEELNGRAGPVPGRGYVHPAEAAHEILDEALQPFIDDLQRQSELDMASAAVEVGVGILRGLYGCRHGDPESLLEYSPDYPAARASEVLDHCEKLGIDLPIAKLLELMPAWTTVLRPPA